MRVLSAGVAGSEKTLRGIGRANVKLEVRSFLARTKSARMLVARGLSVEGGVLVVIDGAKALAAGVAKVFGQKAVVQRCVLHKRRNVRGHLPQELGDKVDRRLALVFANPDPAKGLDAAKRLAGELRPDRPDAAASLPEGLEDMFTARRLGTPRACEPPQNGRRGAYGLTRSHTSASI
jgi:Transposase, Mutator family